MKTQSKPWLHIQQEPPILENSIDDELILYPDLWDSAMLPAELIDMIWHYRHHQR